jgi:hypothetical protein
MEDRRPLVVLICGSRDWSDWELIEAQIFKLSHGSRIVHGDCRGADRIADCTAKELLYEVQPYPAQWREGGKYQPWKGLERNQRMLDEEHPDEIWAFHDDLADSKGTADMVNRAQEQGFLVKVFSHENPMGKTLPIRLSLW